MYDDVDIGHDLKMAFEDGYQAGVEAAQPKWISVDERLPEEGETVLCYYESDLMGVCTRLHEIWEDSYGYWESDDAITHWMPMPEPPKEVEICKRQMNEKIS